jgi:hypothetical protein
LPGRADLPKRKATAAEGARGSFIMRELVIQVLLGAMVLAVWLGCLGFLRRRAPLDRLHWVAFVNTVAGAALVGAVFVADGASSRAVKVLAIVLLGLLGGAVGAR